MSFILNPYSFAAPANIPITASAAWKIQAASATTGAVTLSGSNGTTSAPTAGKLLIVGVQGGEGAAGVSSHVNHAVSDNIGGTSGWTKIAGINDNVGNFTISLSLWYKVVPSGLTQIECNAGVNVQYVNGFIQEFNGSWGTGAGIFTSGEVATLNHGSSQNPITTGTITTATPDSLLIALEGNGANGTQPLNGAGTNPTGWALISSTYSQEANAVAWWPGSMPYRVVTSTVTNAVHTWTTGSWSSQDATIIAAFHAP